MSIVYTADVFCDGDDCQLWVHGLTSGTIPTKTEARANAKVTEGWQRAGGRDLCPTCWRKLQEQKS